MAAETSHWNAYAARWQLVGPPLRPAPSDVDYVHSSVARLSADAPPASALLLGVTPELARIAWQPPLSLVAVDQAEGMVRAVWPGDTALRRGVVGNWLALELPEAPFDLVLGDGVFSIFEYPSGYARFAAALAGVTKPGGLLSIRLFCRPESCEPLDAVFEQLFAGQIGNFHVFKWRLAMALQGDATRGVRLADIWSTFCERASGVQRVAERTGWPETVVGAIEGYRDVQDRYSFSTEREVVETLGSSFELIETWRPSYELGERCPHLTFRRRFT